VGVLPPHTKKWTLDESQRKEAKKSPRKKAIRFVFDSRKQNWVSVARRG